MPSKTNSEHVVALPLQPIGGAVDVVHAVNLEGLALGDLRFDSEKTAVRKRPKVPDDFYWHFSITILHRSDVAQKIVLLRLVVVQPTNNLLHRCSIHVDHRLSPDHF